MPELDLQAETDLVQPADVRELLEPHEGPCISIYLPTTSYPPESDQNRIRFKNALKLVEDSLGLRERQHAEHSELLEPLLQLADDVGYWGSQRQGFAAFRCPGHLRLRRLLRPVPEMAVVADSFHVKPMIRIVQASDRYQVLAVSLERVALYEGVGDQALAEVPLHPEVPRSMAEAIGEPSRVTKTRRTIYDQGETDARDAQLRRFFRRVDEAVLVHHSRRAKVPLILAALSEYQGIFHDASHNPHLVEGGIRRDPFKDIDERELRDLAWDVLQPVIDHRVEALHNLYGEARAKGKASDRVEDLGPLAVFGRLGTFMLQEGHAIGGTLDRGTGAVTFKPIENPAVDDVIDDIAELVMSQDGEVLVLPADKLPTDTGVAGIERY